MGKLVGPAIQLVTAERSYNPRSGFRTTFTWRGTRAAIESKANQLAAVGLEYRTTQNGASYTLVANFPDLADGTGGDGGGTPGDVAEVWEFDQEDEMVSVWSLAVVDFALQSILAANGAPPAQIRKGIERDLADGVAFSLQLAPALDVYKETLLDVYDLLRRGVEAIPFKRPTISRTRTLAYNSPQRAAIQLVPNAYTTAGLIEVFNVPSLIAQQIPALPKVVPPAGTFWGWRWRLDKTRFIGSLAKVEENRDWVFAAWPVLAFNRVGATGESLQPLV